MFESEVEERGRLTQTKWRPFGVEGLMGRGHLGENSVEHPGLMAYPMVSLGGVQRDIAVQVKRRSGGMRADSERGIAPPRV